MTHFSTKRLVVVCGLLWKQDRVLLVQRGAGRVHAGQWEFPGGKVEAGETPAAALVRELREELAVEVAVGAVLPAVERPLDAETQLVLLPHHCQLVRGTVTLLEHQQLAWLPLAEAARLELSVSDRLIVERLLH